MITINFYPETDRLELQKAADKYNKIWQKEGERMANVIEKVSKLNFKSTKYNAIIYEGISSAVPLRFRASYKLIIKKGAIIHELCHKLLMQYDNNHLRQSPLKQHKDVNLILYDIWNKIYGGNFAMENVKIESGRVPFYKEAWDWTLSMTKNERAEKFRELKGQ